MSSPAIEKVTETSTVLMDTTANTTTVRPVYSNTTVTAVRSTSAPPTLSVLSTVSAAIESVAIESSTSTTRSASAPPAVATVSADPSADPSAVLSAFVPPTVTHAIDATAPTPVPEATKDKFGTFLEDVQLAYAKLYEGLQTDLRNKVVADLKESLRDEVITDLKQSLRAQVEEELRLDLWDSMRDQAIRELYTKIEEEFRARFEADVGRTLGIMEPEVQPSIEEAANPCDDHLATFPRNASPPYSSEYANHASPRLSAQPKEDTPLFCSSRSRSASSRPRSSLSAQCLKRPRDEDELEIAGDAKRARSSSAESEEGTFARLRRETRALSPSERSAGEKEAKYPFVEDDDAGEGGLEEVDEDEKVAKELGPATDDTKGTSIETAIGLDSDSE